MLYAFITKTNRITKKPIKVCIVADDFLALADKLRDEVHRQGHLISRTEGGEARLTIELGKVQD